MKKFFDRYLFSRMGLQITFSIAVILIFSVLFSCIRSSMTEPGEGDFYNGLTWGFRQIMDGGSVARTLRKFDQFNFKPDRAPVVFATVLLSWLIGMVFYSFVTGAVVNAFDGRRNRIEAGQTRYKFRDHGIVIGWDRQGAAVVKTMLRDWKIREVLIASTTPAKDIRAVLKKTLEGPEAARVCIYNSAVSSDADAGELQAELARAFVVLGEQNDPENDGETLRIVRLLRKAVRNARTGRKGKGADRPIKLYLHIEDPVLYTQAWARKEESAKDEVFDLELCNFYESWAWKCWSQIGSEDGGRGKYLPLRFDRASKRVELFVIGANAMGQAFINYAIPLMNYGDDGKHCRVTLFDADGGGEMYLPEKRIADALPEVEVAYRNCSGGSEEANDIMWKAVRRGDTSVTIVIAVPGAGAAVRAYAALSNRIRRKPISVLVWQSTGCDNCIDKELLQTGGDRTRLHYFGMTDILPWMDTRRQELGRNINYWYEFISGKIDGAPDFDRTPLRDSLPGLLKQCSEQPFGKEEQALARRKWNGLARWERWSSINSGDSLKEKRSAFGDRPVDTETCLALLRAEHNRWWTERLLAGWSLGEKKDEQNFLHPRLIPFDRLDAKYQALDLPSVMVMNRASSGE